MKRFFRNYWRILNRVRASKLPEPFVHAPDIESVHQYFSAFSFKDNYGGKHATSRIGRCYVCQKQVTFSIDRPEDGSPVNWRETLSCPICGLMNRWRSCLHVFDAICEPTENDRIYLTETLSPVYQNLASRYPLLQSSEYFTGHEFGTLVDTPGGRVTWRSAETKKSLTASATCRVG